MADDTTNRGRQDRSRISLSQDHEVRYWTQTLVSEEALERAVRSVGNSADGAREHWGKR